jgi:hypothetical protein
VTTTGRTTGVRPELINEWGEWAERTHAAHPRGAVVPREHDGPPDPYWAWVEADEVTGADKA